MYNKNDAVRDNELYVGRR